MHPFSFPVRSHIDTNSFFLRYVQYLTFYNYGLKVLIFLKSLTFDSFESSYSEQGPCRILSFGLLLSLFGEGKGKLHEDAMLKYIWKVITKSNELFTMGFSELSKYKSPRSMGWSTWKCGSYGKQPFTNFFEYGTPYRIPDKASFAYSTEWSLLMVILKNKFWTHYHLTSINILNFFLPNLGGGGILFFLHV